MTVMPMNFVRFGDDAPAPAGTYVHVGELLAWLAENGHEDAAMDLAPLESAPHAESAEVFGSTLCDPFRAANSQPQPEPRA